MQVLRSNYTGLVQQLKNIVENCAEYGIISIYDNVSSFSFNSFALSNSNLDIRQIQWH
jgi:selenocysteine lyase/cysteine desulfurase